MRRFHEEAAEQEGEEALQAARLDDVQGEQIGEANGRPGPPHEREPDDGAAPLPRRKRHRNEHARDQGRRA